MQVHSITLFNGSCKGCQPLKPQAGHHDPILDGKNKDDSKVVIVLADNKCDTFEKSGNNMIEPVKKS